MKSIEDALDKLIKDLNISRELSEKLKEKFKSAAPEIQQGLLHYVDTGNIPDEPKISGFSPKTLYERGEPVTGAFLSMDWLMREPEKALPTIKRGRDIVFEGKK